MKLTGARRDALVRQLEASVDAYAVRIAPVYAALDWRWNNVDGSMLSVPSASAIAAHLRQLIALLKDSDSICSGGLSVTVNAGDNDVHFDHAVIEFVDTLRLGDLYPAGPRGSR